MKSNNYAKAATCRKGTIQPAKKTYKQEIIGHIFFQKAMESHNPHVRLNH
jgi:hypothetical protein